VTHYYNDNSRDSCEALAGLMGNAIVPQLAAEFLRAWMESE